jgi:hypothetical protein
LATKRKPSAKVKPLSETGEPTATSGKPEIILDAEATAAALFFLLGATFGGQPERRPFRASFASIRDISRRPRTGTAFLEDVAMHLARTGVDLILMDSYVVVQQATRHESLRRAPASLRAAARAAAINGMAKIVPSIPEDSEEESE